MPELNELLAIKINSNLKEALKKKIPDTTTRNNIIRIVLQKIAEGSIRVRSNNQVELT